MMEQDIYRMIDACTNRGIEGLRVAEDILRFIYNSPDAGILKELRHELLASARQFPQLKVIEARDVSGDRQKFQDLPSEVERASALECLGANLHRAMEAVRTLEESAKMVSGTDSAPFQKIRFSIYTFESRIMCQISRQGKIAHFHNSLYAILDSEFVPDNNYIQTAERLISGGASVIQLRMKHAPKGECFSVAQKVSEVCKKGHVLFVVNDHLDIAIALDADCVHIGQDDMPVPEARRILPHSMCLGLSTHSLDEARKALDADVDYIALGPVYDTKSKTGDNIPGIGLDAVTTLSSDTNVPIVSIGGITPERCQGVIDAGSTCCAVISGLYKNNSIEENCRAYLDVIKSH